MMPIHGDLEGPLHLMVDVGNTEVVLGLFRPEGRDVLHHWRISSTVPRTPDELFVLIRALLREDAVDPGRLVRGVIGSVVPGVTAPLTRALERMIPGGAIVLDGPGRLPITLDVDEPRTVGVDRIVNTLAASVLHGTDTVVVDLGTATTYDCITSEGVFLGGVIAPGILAGEEWLSRRAAKLPRVEFRPPERVIGRRTETCLHSGLFYSAIDAMDGIVRRILVEWERPDALVVATGGFAELVAPYSGTIVRAETHLTLVGLQLAGEYQVG
jgi:type III pantothenate kinase